MNYAKCTGRVQRTERESACSHFLATGAMACHGHGGFGIDLKPHPGAAALAGLKIRIFWIFRVLAVVWHGWGLPWWSCPWAQEPQCCSMARGQRYEPCQCMPAQQSMHCSSVAVAFECFHDGLERCGFLCEVIFCDRARQPSRNTAQPACKNKTQHQRANVWRTFVCIKAVF